MAGLRSKRQTRQNAINMFQYAIAGIENPILNEMSMWQI